MDVQYQFNLEEIEIQETMKTQEHLVSVYDVYFILNNERVRMTDKDMIITIGLKEQEKYFEHYKVVYIDESGKVIEEFIPDVADDYSAITFQTKHLSYYGIIAWNDEIPNINEGNTSEEPKDIEKTINTTGVTTGVDSQPIAMYITLFIVSGLGIGISWRKKRKIKQNK